VFSKKKYTLYDDGGKVVIISSDKTVCINYIKTFKGVITNG